MATKINGKQIDLLKAPVTGSNSTLLHDIGAGLTLTGSVFLLADPAEDLQAATKQYVDSVTGGAIPTRSIAFGQADGSGFAGDKELVYLTGSVANEFSGALIYGRFDGFPELVTSTGRSHLDCGKVLPRVLLIFVLVVGCSPISWEPWLSFPAHVHMPSVLKRGPHVPKGFVLTTVQP